MTTSTDPFGQAPASTAGGAFVRLHQLAYGADKVTREYASTDPLKHQTVVTSGRLVFITPTKAEVVSAQDPKDPTRTKTRITADVVVLNGSEIKVSINDITKEETDLPEPLVPNSATAIVKGMYITTVMLGNQLEQQLAKGDGKGLLGRLGKLKAQGTGQPPYILCEHTEDELALARAWVTANRPNPFAS